MSKYVRDSSMDKMLRDIKINVTKLRVTKATCSTYALLHAITLASASMASNDFSYANGDVSGRKLTVAQQANLSVASTGTATHIILDDGNEVVLRTTCTAQKLVSGNTVTVPAFDDEIADAS